MIFVIPYTILGKEFGFTPISISILVLITIIVAIYITFVEIAKRLFYRKITM